MSEYVRGVLDTLAWGIGLLGQSSVKETKARMEKFRRQLINLCLEDFETKTKSLLQ